MKKKIFKAVEAVTGISKKDIKSGSRNAVISQARHLACYFLRLQGLTHQAISDAVNNKSHISSMRAFEKISYEAENYEDVKALVYQIKKIITTLCK